MTNYNGSLDEVLAIFASEYHMSALNYGHNTAESSKVEAKATITSLIKELVYRAKPKTMPSNLSPENYEKCERVVNQYHQNLLKALEEK